MYADVIQNFSFCLFLLIIFATLSILAVSSLPFTHSRGEWLKDKDALRAGLPYFQEG
jgi:hypothetical protein